MPKLLKQKTKKLKRNTVSQVQCTICQDKVKKSTYLLDSNKKKVCNHKFCFECIKQWKKNTCPNCRAAYSNLRTGKKITKVETSRDDIPPIILSLIDGLMMSSEIRRHFLRDFINNENDIRELWRLIEPVVIFVRIRHNVETHRLLHQDYPAFAFFLAFLQRIDHDIQRGFNFTYV